MSMTFVTPHPLCSLETAKQKLEEDRLRKEAEQRVAGKRKKLAELKHRYQEMLKVNQTLSEHVHLTPEVRLKHTNKNPLRNIYA